MKFLNIFKNRTVLGITCIVLAFIICFVVSPLVSRSGNKTVSVVRATADIKSGDEITKDMVTEVSNLSEKLEISTSTVSRYLDKLQKLGIIERDGSKTSGSWI